MKILKDREEYFGSPELNYSFLKAFDNDPCSVHQEREVKGPAIDYGSAVDVLAFDGLNEYHEKFCTLKHAKPTSSSLVLAESLIEMDSIDIDTAKEEIKRLGLWKSQKDETKEKKITSDLLNYVDESINAKGKTSFTEDEAQKVSEAVYHLRTNNYTLKYFTRFGFNNDFSNDHQLALTFEYKGYKMKAMLDILHIDHKKKTIEPIDLKTTSGSISDFHFNAVKYRYDLQAEIYTKAIESYRDDMPSLSDYNIAPFKFIVSSKKDISKPVIFEMSDKFIDNINEFRYKKIKKLDEILKDFEWHSINQSWEYPKEVYQKGFVKLV